jgi:hypothetical protein
MLVLLELSLGELFDHFELNLILGFYLRRGALIRRLEKWTYWRAQSLVPSIVITAGLVNKFN